MENLKLMYDNGLNFSTLTVCSKLMNDCDKVYNFYKSISGLTGVDFLPMRSNCAEDYRINYGHFIINL